jgi:sterol desaturase/sphingolipid hydroxylase (fatty acid hydroxylase superfamily)
VTLAVMSLASYVTHRLSHEIPLLWRLHRVHHSDTHLDVSTTVRMHPLELAVVAAVQGLAVALFGLPPWAVVVHETLKVVAILVSHANIRLPARLEAGLGWLLVTPDMHRFHHSSFQPETNSNYGAIFSVWDRLFGTYVALPRVVLGAIEFGLGELRGDKASSFWWQLWSPFVRDYSDRAPVRTALELISLRRSEEEPAAR